MKRTITHKMGHEFEIYAQFISKENKTLILAKNTRRIPIALKDVLDINDIQTFRKNHWFVLYGQRHDDESTMGLVRLAFPKAERAITIGSASKQFNAMVQDINSINFEKIKNETSISN